MTTGRYPVSIQRPQARARFEASGQPDALLAALRAASLSLPSRPNSAAQSDGTTRWTYWLGPRRFVVTSSIDEEAQLGRLLGDAFAAFALADVCCVTDMVLTFDLLGGGACALLSQGTALDISNSAFSAGSVTMTDLWGIAAMIERPLDLPECRRVTVDRSLGGFVEGWLWAANGLSSAHMPGVMRTALDAQNLAKPPSAP